MLPKTLSKWNKVLPLGFLLAASSSMPAAIAPFFKVGVGDAIKAPYSPYPYMHTVMASDGVTNHFQAHWFHAGWKGHFPSGVGPAACSSCGEYNTLNDYKAVLSAGKILVLYWWWHGAVQTSCSSTSYSDQPCNSARRSDAEATLNSCLVPLLNALNVPGEVWVVLEPEYNVGITDPNGTGDACGSNRIHRDPSWGTHLNNMITAVKGVSNPNITLRVGPSIGGFVYDENVYNIEPSLQNCLAQSDFLLYHAIKRADDYTQDPWAAPSPEQIKSALSTSRYLRKRFNKRLMMGYWSASNSVFGQTAQDNALKDVFDNRAELEADGVESFGPYWYFDNGYAGEGLRPNSSGFYTAHARWKTESNAIYAGSNGTHSLSFVGPDHGDIYDAGTPLPLQWISRGKPATGSTYSLAYRVNGGPDVAVSNPYSSGGPYPDSTVFNATLDACAITPSADVQVKITANDLTYSYSRPFTVRNANFTSNAQHTFDTGGTVYGFAPGNTWSPPAFASAAQSSANYFHGGGALELGGTFSNSQQEQSVGANMSITLAGGDTRVITAHVYIPFDLNPTVDMGASVSSLVYKVQLNGATYDNFSSRIPLKSGWNRVPWTITAGTGGTITHVDLIFFNKWGQAGCAALGLAADPKIYVDEIRYGGSVAFSPNSACSAASPTNSPTATRSPSPGGPSPTPTASPTTGLASPTPTPTSAAACAYEYNFDAGTTQGFASSDAALTSLSSSLSMPHDGPRSLAVGLNLINGSQPQAIVGTQPALPADYSGKILTYWLYIPAGMSNAANPSGATLYVKTGAAWAWSESTWLNLPSTAGWIQLSLNMASVANANDVKEVGFKVALGGTSPNWSGTVYVDSLGPPPACPSSTPTPLGATATSTGTRTASPTATASPTRSNTPLLTSTFSASPTRSATPSYSPSGSPSASPTASATPSNSPTRSATPTQSSSPVPGSPTFTLSATPSFTSSATRSSTSSATPSFTASASSSPSATPTLSRTSTATSVPSASVTPSVTASVSPTYTNVPAGSSATVTPSTSPTASSTLASSATATLASSATATLVSSATATLVSSPSSTAVSSPSQTAVSTASNTPLPGASATPTLLSTSSFTLVPSPSATPPGSPTGSPTATPSPTTAASGPTATATSAASSGSGGSGELLKTLPALHPISGSQALLAFKQSAACDEIEVRVYSRGYQLVRLAKIPGGAGPGWYSAWVDLSGVPSGTHFYVAQAVNAGAKSGQPQRATLFISR